MYPPSNMKNIILLLFCLITLSVTAQISIENQFHTIDNRNNIHITFDLKGVSKNDFISFKFSYEYYDYASSRFITLTPLRSAIVGANDDRYIFIYEYGTLEYQKIIWKIDDDDNVSLASGLPSGNILIDVYRYTKQNSREVWKLLKKERNIRTRYEKQLNKGHSKRASRLKIKLNRVVDRRMAQK